MMLPRRRLRRESARGPPPRCVLSRPMPARPSAATAQPPRPLRAETFSGLRARCSAGTAANLGIGAARPGEIDRSEDRIADAESSTPSPVFDTTPERSHPRIIGLCRRRESAIPPPPTRLDVDRIHTGGLYRDEYLAPLRNGGGNRRHGETLRFRRNVRESSLS